MKSTGLRFDGDVCNEVIVDVGVNSTGDLVVRLDVDCEVGGVAKRTTVMATPAAAAAMRDELTDLLASEGEVAACPRCGCDEIDELVWTPSDEVMCDRCGCRFDPIAETAARLKP